MWQWMRWPGAVSRAGGSSTSQIAPTLRGQRVWKRQPGPGSTGLGTGPSSRILRCSARGVGDGDGREQRLRVGVIGRVEQLGGGARLADLAHVHDGDAVGEVAHDREVVGDEEERGAGPALEINEKIQDGGLHGDVEGGQRLVADDHVGLGGEGAGDGHALLLAARELVRVAPRVLARQDARRGEARRRGRGARRRGRGANSSSGRRSVAPTFRCGFSVDSGFWKITWMRRRRSRGRLPGEPRERPALEADLARRSARAAPPPRGRAWSCRSRSRPPRRAVPPPLAARLTPSTARTARAGAPEERRRAACDGTG